MARAADTAPGGEGVQRGRGGFYRAANDTPYISDPSGALVASGPRKGLPKRIAYSSASNYGTLIENTTSIAKWNERGIVVGLSIDQQRAELARLARTTDEAEARTIADGIIVAAKRASRLMLAADRGTHAHTITELVDADQPYDDLDGTHLDLTEDHQAAIAFVWYEMLTVNGLEVLAIESSVVDDEWHIAGTLDRIVRATRDLRFVMAGGEIRIIPAGTVFVLDLKTGSLRQTHAIQVAGYAKSLPYDTEIETRSEWPWPISQEHAVIASLSMRAVLDGEPHCDLIYVDLVKARQEGGAVVAAAKAWAKLDTLYSTSQLGHEEPAVESEGAGDRKDPGGASGIASSPSDSTLLEQVAKIARSEGKAAAAKALKGICPVCCKLHCTGCPTPDEPELSPYLQQAVLRSTTPEDGDLVADEFAEMQVTYSKLSVDARKWIAELTTESIQADVSFHAAHSRSQRRYHIIRSLVALGESTPSEAEMRSLIEPVIGAAAQLPDVKLGHLLGSMNWQEAQRFAALVADHTLGVEFDSAGRPRLAELAINTNEN